MSALNHNGLVFRSSSKPSLLQQFEQTHVHRRSVYKGASENLRIDLLSEHQSKNNTNFFHLIDEAKEAWKDKLDNLEFKGKNQKTNLKDKFKREINVLNTKIENETKERDALE